MSDNKNSSSAVSDRVTRIVIVGGGSAGWLTASVLAAEHRSSPESDIDITLIESPDIKPIGVGEGTWPSMRATLHKIGLSETDFIRRCDASFKQGTRFVGWAKGGDEEYFHPFTVPLNYQTRNPAIAWHHLHNSTDGHSNVGFAEVVCPQSHLCRHDLAPKTITTPEYAFGANYGYHLNAGKFSEVLQEHAISQLGVKHVLDNVVSIQSHANGDIAAVVTQENGELYGDLFIDCSGFASLLLGQHYDVPFVAQDHILFNDSALAVQVPYPDSDSPIRSTTGSTALDSGWVWDIGLSSRRGVGYVYSSQHSAESDAEQALRQYLLPDLGKAGAEAATLRKLEFKPGHREHFWHKNCVAVGLSAGFLEPLEASALVLVELSASMISEQLPENRAAMKTVAERFNRKFLHHWARIIDFLKLHYILSEREDSEYWKDHRRSESIPDSLQTLVELWRTQYPWHYDTTEVDEMFPSASYQYVLYGMGFETQAGHPNSRSNIEARSGADAFFRESSAKARQLLASMPTNRTLLNKINEFGLQTI